MRWTYCTMLNATTGTRMRGRLAYMASLSKLPLLVCGTGRFEFLPTHQNATSRFSRHVSFFGKCANELKCCGVN